VHLNGFDITVGTYNMPCKSLIMLANQLNSRPSCNSHTSMYINATIAFLLTMYPDGSLVDYLADEFRQSSNVDISWTLRFVSPSSLFVRRTRLSTIGDQTFPATASWLWNTVPQNLASAPSLTVSSKRLKTHLFKSFLHLIPCSVRAVNSPFRI